MVSGGHLVTFLLSLPVYCFLFQHGQAKLRIVQPYPVNIYPIEGTDAEVTCVAYDVENKTLPERIVFVRQDAYGDYFNVSGPRVTFTSRTELEGWKLVTTMHIKNVTENDDDKNRKHECWVFEPGKDEKTAPYGFSVTVILRKYIPEIAVTPNIVANPGDKVSLTCNVTNKGHGGLIKLKYMTWTKGDTLLERVRCPDPDDPLGTLSPITTNSVKPEDGGTYTCRLLVKLFGTTDYNITGYVSVSVKPTFVGDISNQEVKSMKGEEVKFKCAAVGFPMHVEWKQQRKSEKRLQCINGSEESYNITREDRNSPYVLTINDVAHNDEGKYFCCLSSNCSKTTNGCQEWTLEVKGAASTLQLLNVYLTGFTVITGLVFMLF